MSEQEDETGLTPFEADLAALAPRVNGFQRERLIFEAGQAAAAVRDRGAGSFRFRRWAWPVAFSAMTAVATALLIMLCIRPEPKMMIVAAPQNEPAGMVSGIPVQRSVAPSTGTPSMRDALDDSVPAWLPLWFAGSQPIDYAPPLAERGSNEIYIYPTLRTELRRPVVEKLPPPELDTGGATVLAQGPLSYHELFNQLDEKKPERPSAFYRPSPDE